jgi:hypothetical protein
MLRRVSRLDLAPPDPNGNPLVEVVEVPLDGTETKSEDYQRDVRGVLPNPS